jgi:hypothetical protein
LSVPSAIAEPLPFPKTTTFQEAQVRQADKDANFPAGSRETSPLVVGIIGISIPVSLLALAAVGGSVVVLVLAVLAMFGVGAATLAFVMRLASDPPELDEGAVPAE